MLITSACLRPFSANQEPDGIRSSEMLNRLLQSLFAARKQNYIIIYIRHYKICKKERKLQLCMYNKKLISSERQIKGKLAAAND